MESKGSFLFPQLLTIHPYPKPDKVVYVYLFFLKMHFSNSPICAYALQVVSCPQFNYPHPQNPVCNSPVSNKGKGIPLEAWSGPEGSKRLRLLDFKTIGA